MIALIVFAQGLRTYNSAAAESPWGGWIHHGKRRTTPVSKGYRSVSAYGEARTFLVKIQAVSGSVPTKGFIRGGQFRCSTV